MPSQLAGPGVLEILHLDDDIVAINKPSGLLTHRSPVDRHETRFAVQLLRDQIGQRVFPVHRLDKPTSGVLLFALNPQSARVLSNDLASTDIEKTYLAVVRGYAPESGCIDHAIRPRPDPLAGIGPDAAPEQAITRFRRLGTVEWPEPVDRYPCARYSLMEVQPETGRRHQIRRHLKHIAYPLIGDTTYGKAVHNRFFEQRFGASRLLLHAWRLRFNHPAQGTPLALQAGLDALFEAVLESAGWSVNER